MSLSIIESLRMAFAALTANKLRAMLTTLGVVIGITTVLLMGWFLGGLDSALERTLSIFGDDILYVDKFDWTGGNWFANRNRKSIDYQQYLLVRDRIRSAQLVLPTSSRYGVAIRYGELEMNSGSVMGVTHDYAASIGGNLVSGRFFNEVEDETGTPVCVIGANVAENLFPDGLAEGHLIRIDGLPFTVIGVLPKRGGLGMDMVDNQVLIPLRRFFNRYGVRSRVVINVKAGGVDRLDDVRAETIGAMRQVRSLAPGEKDDFAVNTQEAFRQQTDLLRYSVWGVGLALTGLSFLVGSIGIMNIMFVSVSERTKEIGIRKALGATRRSVLVQFLIEAVALCLFGAAIALVIAIAATTVVSSQTDIEFLQSAIPLSQIAVAVIVSMIVGVMAGIIPALRASRLDPVDALRAE